MSTPQPPEQDHAYAIAQRYAAGELSWEETLPLLVHWNYEPAFQPAGEDWIGVEPEGSFERTVGRAADEGLLSDEEYDQILKAQVAAQRGRPTVF